MNKFNIGDKVVLTEPAMSLFRKAICDMPDDGWAEALVDSVANGCPMVVKEVAKNTVHLVGDFFLMTDQLELFKVNNRYAPDEATPPEVVALGDKLVPTQTEWTDNHYDNNYILTQQDIERGFVKVDPYFVSKIWKIGSKDDSGALWHCFKTIARYGEKNSKEREIRALYAQVKRLAEIEGIEL